MAYKKSNNIIVTIAMILVCVFVLPLGLTACQSFLGNQTNTEASVGKDGISPHIGKNGN